MSTEMKLPENAYGPLKKGEVYVPVVTEEHPKEWTLRSILAGIGMLAFFAAAAAYIAAKLGQGIEIAIPIAVLMAGYSAMVARKFGILENVQVIAIGATSGIVVGGAIFVMPAAYILETQPSFLAVFLGPCLGAILGVLMLITLRPYFINQMHGQLPFPEARATTGTLLAGAHGGTSGKTLFYGVIFGFAYDYLVAAHKIWNDVFSTEKLGGVFDTLTIKAKIVVNLNTSAAIMALGYLIKIKYASIIMAGSFFSTFVLVPLFVQVNPEFAAMDWSDIRFGPVKQIGIGAIFSAAVISIFAMIPVIWTAFSKVLIQTFRSGVKKAGVERWQQDIGLNTQIGLFAAVFLATFLFFRFLVLTEQASPSFLSLVATLAVFGVSFLFSAVSAWAVATISVTPISGMTITGIVITAAIMLAAGLNNDPNASEVVKNSTKLALVMVGGVVCTALSMTGSLITQFRVGGWLGATPRKIQWSNIIFSVLAAALVGGMVMLFSQIYGYSQSDAHPNPLPVPQASAIAAVIKGAVGGSDVPWVMYGFGTAISIILAMAGLRKVLMAFALGMYLPIEYNAPLIVGALVAWFLSKSRHEERATARVEKGEMIANGLIAGGAFGGLASSITLVISDKLGVVQVSPFGLTSEVMNIVSIVAFLAMGLGYYLIARRVKMNSRN